MTPNDIINRPAPASPVCVDCNAPATVVDRPMPLCDRCAKIILCPDLKLIRCLGCGMDYDSDSFDRCPNADCRYNDFDPDDPDLYDFDGPEPEDE